MTPVELAEQPVEAGDRQALARRGLAGTLILLGLVMFFWRQWGGVEDALRLALPDRDDMMRLLGVRDLLAGQGWFDPTQYRYLPPEGVPMHWSRLVDLPFALGMSTLAPLIGGGSAESVVVASWPLLLFALYAGLIGWGAWRLFGPMAAGFAVFVAGQMIVFSDLFAAGRIDHHNIQVILVAGAAIGFGLSVGRGKGAVASGVLSAASLAVGLETLPFVACIGLAYAGAWILKGETARRNLRGFSGGLAATSIPLFLAQTAPSQWLTPACDALSPPWLVLTTGAGLAAEVLTRATARLPSWRHRLGAAALAGAVPPLAFGVSFPACLGGPYEMVPQPYRGIWLHNIVEAFPSWRFLQANPHAALQAVMPLSVGAIAASIAAWRERGEAQGMLTLLAGLLWLGVALAQFQIRTVYIASAFLPLLAGWFLADLLSARREHSPVPARIAAACGGILMFGIPWAVVLMTMQAVAADEGEASLPQTACGDPKAVVALEALPPGVVLAQIDLGPAILVHTSHKIVAAGYHRAPAGIIAATDAFLGGEVAMRRVAEQFHVDYVVICPRWIAQGRDGAPSFARQLADGRSVGWLQPISLSDGPLQAWRVAGGR